MDSRSHAAVTSTDPRVQAALQDYFGRIDRGERIEVEAFVAQHADVADELRSFLAFDEEARRLAGGAAPKFGPQHPDAAVIALPRSRAEVSTHSVVGKVVETVKPTPGNQVPRGEAAAASMAHRSVVASPPKSAPLPKSPNDLPESFGRYQVKQKLGEGAMGAVYLAEDTLLQRKVALKTPTFEDDTDGELLKRFYREARAVSKLKHNNLCGVYDVGEIDGRHYISMEFVPGKKLQEFIKPDKPMSEKQAMAVVRKIALAMQEAHTHGVIHRDLKPDNIMVNEKGEPVVMDFGLVHKTESKNSTRLTQHGTLIGSPAYMSKEQVEGDPDKLTGATDQYSLGVVLYQLLTSKLPFEGGIHSVLAAILVKEPPPPSEFRTDLNPHLEAVCLKMMAKEASNRYPSMKVAADALAEVAKGTSKATRSVTASVRAIGSLNGGLTESVVGIAGSSERSMSALRDAGSPHLALPLRLLSELPKSILFGSLATGLVLLWAVTLLFSDGNAKVLITFHSDDVEVTFQDKSIKLKDGTHEYKVKPGDHTLHIKCGNAEFDTDNFTLKKGNNLAVTVELLKSEIVSRLGNQEIGRHRLSAIPLSAPQNANRKSDAVGNPANVRALDTLTGHTGPLYCVAYSPDGKRLASASSDQTVKVWDVMAGQVTLTFKGHTSLVSCVAFSSDGKRSASASFDGTLKVWDPTNGQEMLTLKVNTHLVNSVVFSPDGQRLAASVDNTIRVWNAASGEELFKTEGDTAWVTSVAYSFDGKQLASASSDQTVTLWDATNGQEKHTFKGHTDYVAKVAFSPDGKRLASASKDKTVKVWDVTSGQETLTLKGHTDSVNGVVFSSDGLRLASASSDQSVKVWDSTSGQETLTFRGHTDIVMSVAFSPDGKRLASASADQTVKVWDTDQKRADTFPRTVATPVTRPQARPESDLVWITGNVRELVTLTGHSREVSSVAFNPDGTRLATASVDGTVKVWDAASGQEALTLKGHSAVVRSVAYSPDGTRLASASDDYSVRVWDATTGQEIHTLKRHTGGVHCVTFSPDGNRLASASSDQTVKVWDAVAGQVTRTLKGHTDHVSCVTFSPDGKRLASASFDRTVKVWDATTGQETLTFRGHTDIVKSVAFSPDGKRLASASVDQTVKVWDALSGQETLTLKGHTSSVDCVAFSPYGTRLATGSRGSLKVWDARSGQETLTLTLNGFNNSVVSVVFSPDGTRLASAGGAVKIWGTGIQTATSSTASASAQVTELETKLFPSLVHVKVAGDSRMPIGVVTESGVCTVLPGTFQSVELVTLDGKRTFAGTVTSRNPFPFCWIESKNLDLRPVTSAKTGTVNQPQEAFVALSSDGATKLHTGKIEASGAFSAPVEVAPQQDGVVTIGPIFAADGTCLGLSLRTDRNNPIVVYPLKRE